jgi:hypothetical protein
MRHAIGAIAAALMLSACGAEDGANGASASAYATGELPTADTVQRDSDVQIASQQEEHEGELEEERSR